MDFKYIMDYKYYGISAGLIILIVVISTKLFLFNNIINILNKEQCLQCLGLNKNGCTKILSTFWKFSF